MSCDSTSFLKVLPGKLEIKRYSPSILYLPEFVVLTPVLMMITFEQVMSGLCSERIFCGHL